MSLRNLLLLSCLAACADSPAKWQGTVRDSAGVTIVENPAEPLSQTGWAAREVLRIGAPAGESELQFGLIASLDIADDGRIYVLDQQNRRVRIFSEQGEFLDEFGGSGSGPGELSDYAIAAMVGPSDTVWVGDLGNARFERFAPDGEPVGSVPIPVPSGTTPNRFEMLEDGRIVQLVRTVPTRSHPELRDELLLVVNRQGAVRDTLERLPAGRSIEFRGGVQVLSVFAPESLWALGDDDRLYTGISNQYRIEVHEDGRLQRVITKSWDPQPVTEADRRAFLRMVRRSLIDQGTDPMVVEQMTTSMNFADHYPAFASITPGPRGTLWVQHVRTAQDAEDEGTEFDAAEPGSNEYDVFDADGRFVATARLPQHFSPLLHRGDRFWGTWKDELDVQYVMAVEVTPPAR